MPLYQVCKATCNFCGAESNQFYMPVNSGDDYFLLNLSEKDSEFMAAYKQAHPKLFVGEYKYACSNPECREKLERWSRE